MKSLKRSICIIMAAVLLCGVFFNTNDALASTKKDQKKIVDSLKEATKNCKDLSTTLYFAWKFYVNESINFDANIDDEDTDIW